MEGRSPANDREDYTQDGTVDIKGKPVLRSETGRWKACSFIGMGLLTLAVSVTGLKPPSCGGAKIGLVCDKHVSSFQKGIFYFSLYIIAIGAGGTKPNISTMGADQFDDLEPNERKQKLSFFNWWMFSIFFGTLFANSVVVYIQDKVGWSVGYGLPTAGLALSIMVFLAGTPFYRHKLPGGSPFTTIVQVLVAAVRKWNLRVPNDPKELHELSSEEYSKLARSRIDHTASMSFLDRAAVKSTRSCSPWMLCPVTQVEQTKQIMKMLPVLAVTLVPSAMIAQANTLFLKQGTTMDRNMGPHFKIPPAGLGTFVTIAMLISLVVYDLLFVPAVRRYTKNPRGISLLQRMGIGLVLHIIVMIICFLTERKRLSVAREHNRSKITDIVPISIFVLLPQFILMGIADTFVEVAKLEFFYDQAPEGMKSLGTSYFSTSLGIGNFLSTFLLTTVTNITSAHGHQGWVRSNLNVSHLDYYFAFLAILNFLNFLAFLLVAKWFVYSKKYSPETSPQERFN
ncbi:hypothetical protein K2173_018295 [Erythroxylum novogranatense]|uniref:Protein NRT1/ PTR FAMILY 5.2-like n=1 Tax=Erythroxylum novogranatense TaxID=1862640 RepID=A0AAV8UER8_9ROSI|nr:hypothetical protein K2173_018295 [Erythroxylum novogranatense]